MKLLLQHEPSAKTGRKQAKQPGVLCPMCGTPLHQVVSTRKTLDGLTRRRRCFNDHRFCTHETALAPRLSPALDARASVLAG